MQGSGEFRRRCCDWLVGLAAPLVPYDMRADWVREWRAELAYASTRADRSGRRLPLACVWRSTGAFFHAAWLRWDRWRIDMILQDLKHAIRALRARPGFTAVTVLTLAIGIGGTTAIFGAVNAVLLRPLPYPQPDELVRVYKAPLKTPDFMGGAVSSTRSDRSCGFRCASRRGTSRRSVARITSRCLAG